ncbi:glycosyltransferase family 4 protein [Salinimicrobium sp. MT39]|uniref:Glycosyltransferase family 4 protein n=1 Tax=Salinimicrobium profundisediminis TaxID=2994553 RepID=A0A9X3CVM6_9FLAO|nr:glycosyltransferase family 4 protein [Salinimicrobium profundisediminis]MCX2837475.1 glycosyltransferase family 4 protein [Salinimicrobium profundisediminis]
MHIGFLTPEYPHSRSGPAAGLGTSIKNMVTALVENEVKVSIFIFDQQEDHIFTENGIKFHFIKHRSFKLFGWYLHRKFLQNYLNKYIAVDKIDAIEAPDWTGITAFMKLCCPLVIRMNGSDAYFCKLENRKQKQKNFWFEKLALQGADHLLSVSKFTAEETQKIFQLKKEIKVIPNSIDVKRFQPLQEKMQEGSILYFGSMIRKKGVLELPAIFNRVIEEFPTARFLFAGKDVPDNRTGRSTKELITENFSPEAAEKVEWLGSLPYEAILDEIAKARVVVLPSFAEALPMTWIEAMAMEKALITSDIGWAKEVMIEGKTGFMVNPKDHEAYSEKVVTLLKDPELTEQFGKAARERVLKKFSTEVVVKENIRFYEGVVSSQRMEHG